MRFWRGTGYFHATYQKDVALGRRYSDVIRTSWIAIGRQSCQSTCSPKLLGDQMHSMRGMEKSASARHLDIDCSHLPKVQYRLGRREGP